LPIIRGVPFKERSVRRSAFAFTLLAILSLSGCAATATRVRPLDATDRIAGRYAINGSPTDVVVITAIAHGQYRIENPGFWMGVGMFDGKVYWGVFAYPSDTRHGSLAGVRGVQRAELQPDGSFKVHGSFAPGASEFDVVWTRTR
jgi:hypothetical protein